MEMESILHFGRAYSGANATTSCYTLVYGHYGIGVI
ncbi:hypothetical protein ADICEAN_03795 [Cesiribacter andamanensis AMV16]|uniref:Uncharacterized protein n=1 Tax=Cesiribacter andamanensis AMV16 TaxID=1279009 RepID=M7N1H6_9BACT|nr:hypothetical protein ADICEAN_03795 [Cesiribacter andamanensis AMV16]